MAARIFLAARGVQETTEALAGAFDEIEHRGIIRNVIEGLLNIGKSEDEKDPELGDDDFEI